LLQSGTRESRRRNTNARDRAGETLTILIPLPAEERKNARTELVGAAQVQRSEHTNDPRLVAHELVDRIRSECRQERSSSERDQTFQELLSQRFGVG